MLILRCVIASFVIHTMLFGWALGVARRAPASPGSVNLQSTGANPAVGFQFFLAYDFYLITHFPSIIKMIDSS